MLYTFGDSFTWGTSLVDRKTQCWPYVLAQLLNQPLCNLAKPGGNNWYIARKINELEFKLEDIVVIGWTNPDRFELPATQEIVNKYLPNPSDRPDPTDSIPVKRFLPGIKHGHPVVQELSKVIYTNFSNDVWFYEHFKICFQSVKWRLEKVGCRYIMFYPWAWWPHGYQKEFDLYDDNFIDWPNSHEWTDATFIENDGHFDARTHGIVANWLFKNMEKWRY